MICVLGMHRTGTSTVASILDALGVRMGGTHLAADENNPLGYYEDTEILDINKSILAKAGGSWRNPVTRRQVMRVSQYTPAMKQAIKNRQQWAVSPWGFKDPRTCMTIWLWHPLLSAMDTPKYVITERPDGDVIKSLQQAHGDGPWADVIAAYKSHLHAFLDMYPLLPHRLIHYPKLTHPVTARAMVETLAGFVGVGMDDPRIDTAVARVQLRGGDGDGSQVL